MSSTVLVGIQWGDEGKGKIIDVLTRKADAVVRFQGGNNAGHTVEIGNDKYVLHIVPSGIFRPDAQCIIGNGVVVNPVVLTQEIRELQEKGIKFGDRFEISSRSHLIFKYHSLMDGVKEQQRSIGKKIGTTKRGIGPAYADKASRRGIRALEMLDIKRFERRFKEEAEYYNTFFASYNFECVDIDKEWAKLSETAKFLAPYIKDTVLTINKTVKDNKNILFEGAQGMLLDVDYGTYPFVTSSNTTSGGACTGSGLSPRYIDDVVGVMKAYCTRVGEGPFPSELHGEEGEELRKYGREFGATTGRPRRCGWFDAVSARYSCMVNGVNKLAITKLDILDEYDALKVCTAYKVDGKVVADMPSDTSKIARAVPIYETYPGWKASTANAKSFSELPLAAQNYLKKIAELVDSNLHIISVGPNRSQTFTV
ncbi:MAG TPA: adenylosuccinate synthase [Victivallales bacterium]|nr:adenylosuccinate synthase [Victivallales bacterium]